MSAFETVRHHLNANRVEALVAMGVLAVSATVIGVHDFTGNPAEMTIAETVEHNLEQDVDQIQNELDEIQGAVEQEAAMLENTGVRELPSQTQQLRALKTSSEFVLNQQQAAAKLEESAWDGYREAEEGVDNGQLNKDDLCKLPWTNKSVLRCDAEHSFELLNQAFKAEFGEDIDITDSYRDYEKQVAVREELGNTAAVPGYSNHGLGVALDLGSGIPDMDGPQYKWMSENAPAFGWINPPDLLARKGESWHWEYHCISQDC